MVSPRRQNEPQTTRQTRLTIPAIPRLSTLPRRGGRAARLRVGLAGCFCVFFWGWSKLRLSATIRPRPVGFFMPVILPSRVLRPDWRAGYRKAPGLRTAMTDQ